MNERKVAYYFMKFFGFIFGEMASFREWEVRHNKGGLVELLAKLDVKSATQRL
jgi:hypothetical protein